MKTTLLSRVVCVLTLLVLGACGTGEFGESQVKAPQSASEKVVFSAAEYTNIVQYLYVSYYGRPGDPSGLNFWASYLAGGSAPTDVASFNAAYGTNNATRTVLINFGNSAESVALYGTDSTAIVNAIYQNLFNRPPDPAGLAFYVNGINAGLITTAQAAIAIAGGAQGTDVLAIQKKVAVATGFTTGLVTPEQVAAYDGLAINSTIRGLLSNVGPTTDVTSAVSTLLSAISPDGPKLSNLYGIITFNYRFYISSYVFTDVVIFSAANLSDDSLYNFVSGSTTRAAGCTLAPPEAEVLKVNYFCLIMSLVTGSIDLFLFDIENGVITNGIYEYCPSSQTIVSCASDIIFSPDGVVAGTISSFAVTKEFRRELLSQVAQEDAKSSLDANDLNGPSEKQSGIPSPVIADMAKAIERLLIKLRGR